MNLEFIHNYMISSIVFFILFVIYKIIPKNDKNLKYKKMKSKEVKHKEIRCPRCENKYLNSYKHCLVCGEENPTMNKTDNKIFVFFTNLIKLIIFIAVYITLFVIGTIIFSGRLYLYISLYLMFSIGLFVIYLLLPCVIKIDIFTRQKFLNIQCPFCKKIEFIHLHQCNNCGAIYLRVKKKKSYKWYNRVIRFIVIIYCLYNIYGLSIGMF